METRILKQLSKKLGISNQSCVGKASEYMRLLEVRSGSSSLSALNLGGSSLAVMCLELAAGISSGQTVNRQSAIKLSGMNKKLYTSAIKIAERVLDLNNNTTIPELSVQFGCPQAKQLAIQVLKKYETDTQCYDGTADFSQSLFNSVALYSASKVLKQRVEKSKIVETAGVKRSTFDNLMRQMDKIAEKINADQAKPKMAATKRSKTFLESIDNYAAEEEAKEKKKKIVPVGEEEENYEEWKERILSNAYKALGLKR